MHTPPTLAFPKRTFRRCLPASNRRSRIAVSHTPDRCATSEYSPLSRITTSHAPLRRKQVSHAQLIRLHCLCNVSHVASNVSKWSHKLGQGGSHLCASCKSIAALIRNYRIIDSRIWQSKSFYWWRWPPNCKDQGINDPEEVQPPFYLLDHCKSECFHYIILM